MDSDLRERCHSVMQQTLVERDWHLVQDEDSFLQEVVNEVERRLFKTRGQLLASTIEHVVIRGYSHMWHAALCANGAARQQRAFEELHALLYRVAFHHTHDPDQAADFTQDALVRIWKNADQVSDPGSFLWWALTILKNMISKGHRAGKRRKIESQTGLTVWHEGEISASDLLPGEAQYLQAVARLDGSPIDQMPVLGETGRARLEAAIKTCLKNERHQTLIIESFVNGKSYQEIASQLKMTLAKVYAMKHRALSRLRECQDFLDALETVLSK
ncbi:MAG TPA: sigma-70 family RNA polymerase sigma factor [Anaerolineae bacterium]|nr:sigma-70 family RNA polymerase sigma factor [Anaerolineae bacterium]